MLVSVSPATLEERVAACRLLVSVRLPMDQNRAAQHYLDLFESDELDPAGLFVARGAAGAIRGAMVVQALPGALGLAWPPVVPRGRDRIAIEDSLVVASCGWLQARGMKVGQAFATELERDAIAPLLRIGFQRITQLSDLRSELETVEAPDSRLVFLPLTPVNQAEFVATLIATFVGSLDCPEVTGSRTDAELLDGYVEADVPQEHWFVVRYSTEPSPHAPAFEPIGVVLLDRANEAGAFDLTYVGIAPQFRGQRLGAELVKFARHYAKNQGGRVLHLSVDSRNEPALRLYRALSFQASGVRSVFLAHWPPIS